jgi:hypothetical protein
MLTDLGDKPQCESLQKSDLVYGFSNQEYASTYFSIRTNVTDARGIARMGLCLPIECTQDDLDHFDELFLKFTNFGIGLLPTLGINIDTLVFNNQS